MKSFKEILNEASVGTSDVYNASVKIIKFLEKKLNQTYKDFDCQEYTNQSGSYVGYLFVTDTSALRINWEGNKFHSINYWAYWNYNEDPTLEIFTNDLGPGDSSFVKLLPEIANIIKGQDEFETFEEDEKEETVLESFINEKRMEFNGKIYSSARVLCVELYENEYTVAQIKSITGLPTGEIYKTVIKHLYDKGYNLTDISDAVGLSNADVRKYVKTDDDDLPTSENENIKILKGSKETVVPSAGVKKAQEKLNDTEYADPDLVFDELDDYVTLIAKGVNPALLITGQGGIGKSYNVEKILNQYGSRHETWEKVKGRASAASLYATLWYNRNKIVVFDDCDSVLKDPDALNILKGALDNNDYREISWASKAEGMVYTMDLDDNDEIAEKVKEWEDAHKGREGFPNHFIFEGAVIFISNMRKSEIYKKDAALLTRCSCVDIVLQAKDVIKRIETVLPYIKIYKSIGKKGSEGKDITDEELKHEVFEFMKSDEFLNNPKIRGKSISFRVFDQLYKLRWAGLENWKQRSYNCGG